MHTIGHADPQGGWADRWLVALKWSAVSGPPALEARRICRTSAEARSASGQEINTSGKTQRKTWSTGRDEWQLLPTLSRKPTVITLT